MKKVLFYCQHVLGMGHLMRSMALVEGMTDTFQLCFLNGGELIPGFDFPSDVEVVNLAPMKSDANFNGIEAVGNQSLDELKKARRELMLETYARVQPDILIIELFPFGRKKFAFELMPLLAKIRMDNASTKVVCSLRDIMVQRRDQFRHEDRACRILNRYFDQVLVHSDPMFHRLEESFGQAKKLEVPVVYTGYVAQEKVNSEEQEVNSEQLGEDVPLILASIGGGRVGVELLTTTVEASRFLTESLPHRLQIFTGPYLPDDDFKMLESMVVGEPQIALSRFTTQFIDQMAAADLSISMAGYNTSMNILKTGTRAIMLPFCGGNNDEQLIRGKKLAARGLVRLVLPTQLTPDHLAKLIAEEVQKPTHESMLNLDGVAQSVVALKSLAQQQVTPHRGTQSGLRESKKKMFNSPPMHQLSTFLDQWADDHTGPADDINLFLRDDDIDMDEDTLRQLLDTSLARDVPINLEVIPAGLTDAGYRLVADHKRFTPHLVELNQHGWQHLNHEQEGRKCEFGSSRSYAQQYDDIAGGKALLEETFDDLFSPVFTPPWNRCTDDTFRIVDELGFKVFSGLRNGQLVDSYGFRDISVSLDIFHWKGQTTLKPIAEIVTDLISQMNRPPSEREPIGIMLHHKVMDHEAFGLLDALLSTLGRYPFIRFHTFHSLANNL